MDDLLLFRVGHELFAVELTAVDEAIDLEEVAVARSTSTRVAGIVTLRGALVPLYSPALALGVPATGGTMALVVRDAMGRAGIIVDDVDDVLAVRDSDVRALPAGDGRDSGVVRGIVRRGRDLVTVVSLEALVAACRSARQPEAV